MHQRNDLYPHGLWPASMQSNSYPSYCNQGSILQKSSTSTLTPRQRHEYAKHGSCTSLSIDLYFAQEVKLYIHPVIIALRKLVNGNNGYLLDLAALNAASPKRIGALASKQCHLQEITTCWSAHPDGTVGEQIDCPKYVLSGSRNTASSYGCSKVFLDKAEGACAVISKDLLIAMKGDITSLE